MSDGRSIGRSIWAVFAGLLVNVIGGTAADAVLHATGVFPPFGQPMADGLFALALGHRIVWGVAGSYLTARLAPNRPMAHALALGVAGVMIGTAGTLATWNRGPEFGPKWYALAVIAVAIPCAWVGGKMGERRAAPGVPASS